MAILFYLEYSIQPMKPVVFWVSAFFLFTFLTTEPFSTSVQNLAFAGSEDGISSTTEKPKKKKKKKKKKKRAVVCQELALAQPDPQVNQEIANRLEEVHVEQVLEQDLSVLAERFVAASQTLDQAKKPMPNWLARTIKHGPTVCAISSVSASAVLFQLYGTEPLMSFVNFQITGPIFNAVTGCTWQATESGLCSLWSRLGIQGTMNLVPVAAVTFLRNRMAEGVASLSHRATRACVSWYIDYRNRFIESAEFLVVGNLIRDSLAMQARAEELRAMPLDSRKQVFRAAARIGDTSLMRAVLNSDTPTEKDLVDQLPENNDLCAICRGTFSPTDPEDHSGCDILLKTSCNHTFHRLCLVSWFQSAEATCPLCREHALPCTRIEDLWK